MSTISWIECKYCAVVVTRIKKNIFFRRCHINRTVSKSILKQFFLFSLPDLLKLFGLTKRDVSESMRSLVKTFNLDASNIVLNLDEWTLVAIVLVTM